MKVSGIPASEKARLDALHQMQILDTIDEERFDRLTRVAQDLFDVEIVLVSLVDENRQWFKSYQGLNVRETHRDYSFCAHAILEDGVMMVPDARQDHRFHDNPLVTGPPHIRFYAGAPLHSEHQGERVGTLCLIDYQPRTLTDQETARLRDLADAVEAELNRASEKQLLAKVSTSERKVKETATRLTSIIEGTNVGTWEWNVQTGETEYNERWAELVGYTLAELEPISINTWMSLAHPDDLEKSERALKLHFSGELDFYDVECRMRHKKGYWVWVHDRGKIISRDAQGEPLWMAGTHADVTQNRELRDQLTAQKQFLEHIFDSDITAITVLNAQGRLEYANASAQAVLGLVAQSSDSGEIAFNDPQWRIESLDGTAFPDSDLPFARVRRTGQAVTDIRHAIVWPDGHRKFLSINGALLAGVSGDAPRYAFAVHDITAELEAQRSLSRQLKAFEVLNTITADRALDHQEQMQRALALGAEFLGLDCGVINQVDGDQLLVLHSLSPEGINHLAGQTFPLAGTLCAEAYRQDAVIALDDTSVRLQHPNPETPIHNPGAYIGVSLTSDTERMGTVSFSTANPLQNRFQDSEKQFARLLGRWLSTALMRQRAVNELKQSESRFRALFELSPIGIALNDFETGRFLDINEALLRPTGYSWQEFTQLDYFSVTPIEYLPEEQRMRDVLIEQNQYGPFEKEYIRKDGTHYPVLLNGVLMEDNTGRQLIWSIIEDISERKRLEKIKNEFISTVSHELRTPLTSIVGSLKLLNAGVGGALPDSASKMLGIATNNSERLSNLINDLLDMERLASGRMSMTLKRQPLLPIVENSLNQFQSYADKYQVQLRLLAPSDSPVVRVDDQRLGQVLVNLLSNAAKFSQPEASVTVEVTSQKKTVTVAVKDTGTGIPEAFMPQLFEQFAQADASDQRCRSGTGLGLAISKALMDQMDGSINVSSTLGEGSTFYLVFPGSIDVE